MLFKIFPDPAQLGAAAALHSRQVIQQALSERAQARVVFSTGASQFEFLKTLTAMPDINWQRVEMFHLDEYVGISPDHPASFRKYLRERLLDRTGILSAHLLDGNDARAGITQTSAALRRAPVDLAIVGIGENGHLAFNDPPADFENEDAFLIVQLDDACRRQQVGEGWFATIDQVPTSAITMSVKQILKSREIVCVVPEARKAQAVRDCFEEEVSPWRPASILRTHPKVTIYLDRDSASLLSKT